MIHVEERDGGLTLVDEAENAVRVDLEGWLPAGHSVGLDRPVDVTETGSVRRITVPGRGATIERDDRARPQRVRTDDRLDVPTGEHVVRIDGPVVVFVGLSSAFSIHHDDRGGRVSIDLPAARLVSLGFRSRDDAPTDELRVPPTPEGIAAAVTAAGGCHRTETPDRSYPAMRRHPPVVELDREASLGGVPDGSDRPVRFRLPPSLGAVFSASSLAYYLGAAVEVDDVDDPVLVAGSAEHRFSGLAGFPDEVAALLSRVFYLDCLIRNVGPFGFDLRELDLLDRLPVDPGRTYAMSIADRVAEYLSVPFERVAAELPEWPLATSMAPTADNATAIPYLLDRLSLIVPPDPAVLDDRTIIERSLGDFYRSSSDGEPAATVNARSVLEPRSRHGTVHGWIAEGATVDAFKCSPRALSNRLNFLARSPPFSVAVVLNDDAMDGEYSGVVDAYQGRSDAPPIEVDVRTGLTRAELATTLQRRYDVVHYIGHCDPPGLRCLDGNLATADLPACNVGAFFFNACDSYDQGLDLVRRGSVGGAVTLGDVLDDQAGKVGLAFARLLSEGFSVYRSLRLARAEAIMNHQYTVVGDGTFAPVRAVDAIPTFLTASRGADRGYRVRWEVQADRHHGDVFQAVTDPRPLLAGNDTAREVTEDEFLAVLRFDEFPVVFENELYWSSDLLAALS